MHAKVRGLRLQVGVEEVERRREKRGRRGRGGGAAVRESHRAARRAERADEETRHISLEQDIGTVAIEPKRDERRERGLTVCVVACVRERVGERRIRAAEALYERAAEARRCG